MVTARGGQSIVGDNRDRTDSVSRIGDQFANDTRRPVKELGWRQPEE